MIRSAFAVAAVIVFSACSLAPRASAPPAPASATMEKAPEAVSAEVLQDHAGDSVETAVAVPAEATDEGVKFENEWIFGRYGRFRRVGGGTGTVNGRRYNVVDIEMPGGEKHKVFFDITELWEKWKPQD